MRLNIRALIFILMIAPASAQEIYGDARPDAPELAARGPLPVGVRTVTIEHANQLDVLHVTAATPNPRTTRKLTLEIWYPAQLAAGQAQEISWEVAAPLLALWNAAPRPQPDAARGAQRGAARAALGVVLYFGALALGSAGAAAVLRRHLMVWKVFAPRFMAAGAGLLAVDLAAVLGVGLGAARSVAQVSRIFSAMEKKAA